MQKRYQLLLPLLLVSALLVSCSPGHLGGNEIAFVRGGHLWTIDPDGANAFEVVAAATPVIGYAWSPDHHLLVFRLLDSGFAATGAGRHLQLNPLLGVPGDVPASLNTVGLDGGVPITIIPSIGGKTHSNAWWNSSGTRLLYREVPAGQPSPLSASWWVSQNDQPYGIARKALPTSYSIPSFTSDSSEAIGNSLRGVFTTTLAGDHFHLLLPASLPGHPLPATLERLLWQPAHAQPALLYAIPSAPQPASSPGAATPQVELLTRSAGGQITTIATCACTQFAWSPDGDAILYTTGATYTIFTLTTRATYSFTAEDGSAPYWSPDSKFLLLDGPHTLTLLSLAGQQQQQLLLSDGAAYTPAPSLPGALALLQPAPNSLWAADGRHFLVLTRGRLLWRGQALSRGNGLYAAAIDDAGHIQGTPTFVDNGNDTQPGWSYADPNTSFLF
jgi:hypothetical protein